MSHFSFYLVYTLVEGKTYQRVAGEAIFEIGRRLKHVKENDLAHGEFGEWLESVGIHDRMARKFMKIADEITKERTTSSDLGVEALYQIATMSEEHREQPHTVPSTGADKKPDKMTVKELREVKKALKDEKEAREKAEKLAEELAESNSDTYHNL